MAVGDNNTVMIEIGAKIDALSDAVSEVHEKLSTIHDGGEKLGGVFDDLGGKIAAAFSVAGIVEFINHMAELGVQTERTQAMLGLTAQQTLQIGGLAKLSGESMEGLALSLERMSLNVQRSTRDAFNPAAQGLHVLGLNAKDLIGQPTAVYFDKLHDAVSKFAPSLNLTNALMAVGGRNVAQLIPLLRTSAAEWAENKKSIEDANGRLSQFIPQMAGTDAQIGLLSLTMRSLGGEVFNVFNTVIDQGIKMLARWTAAIRDSLKDHGIWYTLLKGIADTVKIIEVGLGGLGVALQAVGISIDWFFKRITTAEANKKFDEVTAAYLKMIKALRGDGGAAGSNGGAAAGAIDSEAQARFAAQIKTMEQEVKMVETVVARNKQLYEADAANYRILDSQKYALMIADVAAADKVEQMKYQSMLKWTQLTLEQRKTLEIAAQNLHEKNISELLKLDQQMMAAEQKVWEGGVSSIENSWNSSLRGLLSKTMTFGQAMKKVFQDLVIYIIEQLEKKLIFEQITSAITDALHIKSVAVVVAEESAKTTAVATGVAARTVARGGEVAGTAAADAAASASAFGFVQAQVAKVIAGVTAFMAPLIGPGAPAAGAAAGAATEAESAPFLVGSIAGWELGTNYVPKTGLARVHEGEQIIPKNMQGAPYSPPKSADSAAPVFHISAWDAHSVAQWLNGGGAAQLAKAVAGVQSRNRSTRPKY